MIYKNQIYKEKKTGILIKILNPRKWNRVWNHTDIEYRKVKNGNIYSVWICKFDSEFDLEQDISEEEKIKVKLAAKKLGIIKKTGDKVIIDRETPRMYRVTLLKDFMNNVNPRGSYTFYKKYIEITQN